MEMEGIKLQGRRREVARAGCFDRCSWLDWVVACRDDAVVPKATSDIKNPSHITFCLCPTVLHNFQ